MPGGGPNLPLVSPPNPYLLSRFTANIPMPTLYAGDSVRKPKLSVIEVLMYNMAALLASIAAGYDVRMTNVSPIHPTLQPAALLNEQQLQQQTQLIKPIDVEFASVVDDRRFVHNTYHGPARHNRAALTSISLMPDGRRSDSPQLYQQHQHHQQQHPSTISTTSGLGSNFTTNTSAMLSSSLGSNNTQPPTPSPRRKISASSFTDNLDYAERDSGTTPPPPRLFESRGAPPPPAYAPAHYLTRGPSLSNDIGGGAHRGAGYFGSNYFPYRPEVNFAYERDCKSYPDYSYDQHHHHHQHHRLPNYYDYSSYEQQVTRTPPPRVPQMGVSAAGHRRTPSNISNSSNINQAFSLENDELPELYDFNNLNLNIPPSTADYHYPSAAAHTRGDIIYKGSPKLTNLIQSMQSSGGSVSAAGGLNRMRDYENVPFHVGASVASPHHHQQHRSIYAAHSTPISPINAQQQPLPLVIQERPASLPFEHGGVAALGLSGGHSGGSSSKLRSSMKKYGCYNIQKTTANGVTSNTGTTPTNQTPPDSLTSDDSSYLSAKEGSISSQHSRVRFSPEAFLDAVVIGSSNNTNGAPPSGHEYNNGTLSHSHTGHSSNTNGGSAANRRVSRRHTSDMAS